MSVLGGSVLAQDGEDKIVMQFPGVTLNEALDVFAMKAGLDMVYDPKEIPGNFIKGRYVGSADQILRRLLLGTGLLPDTLSTGAISVIKTIPTPTQITGIVRNAENGEAISDAHVWSEEAGLGAASEMDGSFTLPSIDPGAYLVNVSHVAFTGQKVLIQAQPHRTTHREVMLTPRRLESVPALVEDGLQARMTNGYRSMLHALSFSGMGIHDGFRTLETELGVRFESERAGIYLQGSDQTSHQVELDGVPVFDPSNLGGLIGSFSPFATRRLRIHKAGFAASKGSQLSGVIVAEHDFADAGDPQVLVQADPISFNAKWSAPFRIGNHSFGQALLSTRLGLSGMYRPPSLTNMLALWNQTDRFLTTAPLHALAYEGVITQEELDRLISEDNQVETGESNLTFSEIHAAVRLRYRKNDQLHASFYQSGNALSALQLDPEEPSGDVDPDESPTLDAYQWSNTLGQVKYTRILTPSLLVSVQGRISRYDFAHDYNRPEALSFIPNEFGEVVEFGRRGPRVNEANDENHVHEVGLKGMVDYLHDGFKWSSGFDVTRFNSKFQINDPTPIADMNIVAARAAGFSEIQIPLTGSLDLTLGGRLTLLQSKRVIYAEPRFELAYSRADTRVGDVSVDVRAGLFRQFVNQFHLSSYSLNSLLPYYRLWLPVDSTVAPPKAFHLASDLSIAPGAGWKVQVESYYKYLPHDLQVNYSALWVNMISGAAATRQDQLLAPNVAFSYGTGLSVEKEASRYRLRGAYQFSRSMRKSEAVLDQEYHHAPWNTPHRIDASAEILGIGPWSIYSRYQIVLGRTWAYKQSYYDHLTTHPRVGSQVGPDTNLDEPDLDKLPAYSRLDVGSSLRLLIGQTRIDARVDLLNVLNRENVGEFELELQRIGEPESVPRYLLPFTPTFSVQFAW